MHKNFQAFKMRFFGFATSIVAIKMAIIKSTNFQTSFLKPQYWGLWLVIGLWRSLMLLPYPWLVKVGKFFAYIFGKLPTGKKRLAVARRNLTLCFPEKSSTEIEELVRKNQLSTGMAFIEVGMAWFWSDRRIQKWSKIEGLEHLNQKDGVLFVGIHFLTLELGARIVGIQHSGIGVYRPNDNPVFDWLQVRGRLRSNKGLLNRKDLRGIIKALRQGESIWYAPDHDYGHRNAVFVPFFAVQEASTTIGTHALLKAVPNCKVVPFTPMRNADFSGYTVKISPPVAFGELKDEVTTAHTMNKVIEGEICQAIDQYMWIHRRFKSRPDPNAPSLYD